MRDDGLRHDDPPTRDYFAEPSVTPAKPNRTKEEPVDESVIAHHVTLDNVLKTAQALAKGGAYVRIDALIKALS